MLSDRCLDALNIVGDGVAWYSYVGYETADYIPLIDALYNLATFIAGQATPYPLNANDTAAVVSRYVVGAILGAELGDDGLGDDELGQNDTANILTLLPEICKVHPRLAKSLDDIYIEITTNADDSFMAKMHPTLLSKLEAVRINSTN